MARQKNSLVHKLSKIGMVVKKNVCSGLPNLSQKTGKQGTMDRILINIHSDFSST